MEDLFSSFQHQGASKAVSTRWRLIVWPLRPATWSTDATTAGPTFEAYRFAVDPKRRDRFTGWAVSLDHPQLEEVASGVSAFATSTAPLQ
jgi:hypothetical protein